MAEEETERPEPTSLPSSLDIHHEHDHSLHLPVAHNSRTPSRTKRRSVSSTLSLDRRHSHHSASGSWQSYPPEDYIGQLRRDAPERFTTPSEKYLLQKLADLGFDVGQLKHSIDTHACDTSAATWWILRGKQAERGETDEVVRAYEVSAIKRRERAAAYIREERRKARNATTSTTGSRDGSPGTMSPSTLIGRAVAFKDEASVMPSPIPPPSPAAQSPPIPTTLVTSPEPIISLTVPNMLPSSGGSSPGLPASKSPRRIEADLPGLGPQDTTARAFGIRSAARKPLLDGRVRLGLRP